MERRIRITDVTLRDGDHAMSHQFRLDDVRRIARGLDDAGVPVVEACHGDGLAGSSLQYGRSVEAEDAIIAAAAGELRRAKLAVLLLPGIGTRRDLRRAADLGARVVRVATHCTEADIAQQHLELARDLGMEAIGFLMMSHMIEPERLAEQARLMERSGARCVYVVDSAGAMTEPEARARVRALRAALDPGTEVGFHAHNNLALAVSNSIAAIDEGATQIDGSTCGLGAGAGNAMTEALVAVCEKLGIATGVDLFRIMDVAEEVVLPIMRERHVPRVDRASLTIGFAGVYSTFLLHAERAAERFGVRSRDVLVELGRRRVVGGQEDMIVDVAVALARAGKAAAK